MQLVSLIDLENGYLQPVDVCHRANQLILPEVACHAVVTTGIVELTELVYCPSSCVFYLVLLVTGYWIEGLYNVPMAVYHAKAYSSRSIHLDPTTVFDSISYRKMFATAKLLFYLLFFFVCIFRCDTTELILRSCVTDQG